ncbi:uncharacterized protein LOC131243629 [Magnolia sinica]|uniref:uncharacterized protein LOC131243629 n=1 Tax=Magnolia sinica TaxID=86752 RepID=UPI00265A0799|nr:uncharacterized protein LOC131243629 [Magnolia sinica]
MEAPLTDNYEVFPFFAFPTGQPFYSCNPCGLPIVSAEEVSRGTIPGATVYYVQNIENVTIRTQAIAVNQSTEKREKIFCKFCSDFKGWKCDQMNTLDQGQQSMDEGEQSIPSHRYQLIRECLEFKGNKPPLQMSAGSGNSYS